MPCKITLPAYAKVNLTLDVRYRRPDGRHELAGVMQRIDLYDEVTVEKADGVFVTCDRPIPEKNTARSAAEAYIRETGCGGVRIHIKKGLPEQAGMGAASADAAAVLRAMQTLYGGVAEERLFELGLSVGADVPFCLLGGAAFAEGVGEILTPLPPVLPELNLIIAKGSEGVSTAALFTGLDLPIPEEGEAPVVPDLHHPDNEGFLAAWQAGDLAALAKCMGNALTAPAVTLCPEIAEVKQRLLKAGALAASMTGSGAAVIGLFATEEDALRAEAALSDLPFAKAAKAI
ncbi:MAG: 4-(cytidine 5'-diphospho)-2-C-methyl-D-erythritol kinase [Clostridia bacterium]|nr:4-(cytidine 5'-diphospho)-2-C-methyl-D-erythritol kinase [Clostridia bacterium]